MRWTSWASVIVALATLMTLPAAVAGQVEGSPVLDGGLEPLWPTVEFRAGQGERSPVLAGGLELFLPTVGFGYAGDWQRGLLPNVVRVGSVVGIVATDVCDSAEGNDATCAVLAGTLAIAHVWATIGAVNTARDHNRTVGQGSTALLLRPGQSGSLRIGMSLRR